MYLWCMEAKTLRSIIQEKGIKQSWIATKLGVTRALVNQWVQGTVTVPEKHKSELKRILQ